MRHAGFDSSTDVLPPPSIHGCAQHPRCSTAFFKVPGGAAAGIGGLLGMAKYITCKTKCPKAIDLGMGGFINTIANGAKSMMSGITNGIGMMGAIVGIEQEEKPYGRDDDGNPLPTKDILKDIHHRACLANCKTDAMILVG